MKRFVPVVIWLALTTSSALAQTPGPLVEVGDPLPGGHSVTAVTYALVNDSGDWVAFCSSDAASGGEQVILRNGGVMMRPGRPLAEPPDAVIERVWRYDLNGETRTTALISAVSEGPTTVGGVYWESRLLALRDGLVQVPGLSPETIYRTFQRERPNDARQVLLDVLVDDPELPSTYDVALIVLDLDENGAVTRKRLLAKEGDMPGSLTDPIVESSGFNFLGFNNTGQAMVSVRTDSPFERDSHMVVFDLESEAFYHLAAEGAVAPESTGFYRDLRSKPLALNDSGDYVFQAGVAEDPTTDWMLVHGNLFTQSPSKYRQAGESVPDIAPFAFDGVSVADVFVTPAGAILHFASWDDPDLQRDDGLFFHDSLVLQEGVTSIEGRAVKFLDPNTPRIRASKSGRYVAFVATLDDGARGAYMLDLGEVRPLPSCTGNEGELRHTSGLALIGETVGLEMDQGQGGEVSPFLLLSDAATPSYPPCGIPVPYGEWIIDVVAPNPMLVLAGSPWNGLPVPFEVAVPNDPALVGRSIYAQGLFFDVGDQVPAPPFRLTNALRFLFSSP